MNYRQIQEFFEKLNQEEYEGRLDLWNMFWDIRYGKPEGEKKFQYTYNKRRLVIDPSLIGLSTFSILLKIELKQLYNKYFSKYDRHKAYIRQKIDELNREFFNNRIKIDRVFILELEEGISGQYNERAGPYTRDIYIDIKHLQKGNEERLEETIYHEMCHQPHFGHGPGFLNLMYKYYQKRYLDDADDRLARLKSNIEKLRQRLKEKKQS